MKQTSREDKRYYFRGDQLIAVGIAFAVTSLAIFVLGIIAGRNIERGAAAGTAQAVTRIPLDPAPAASEAAVENEGGEPAYAETRPAEPDSEPASEKKPAAPRKERPTTAVARNTDPSPAVAAKDPPPVSARATDNAPASPPQESPGEPVSKKEPAGQPWAVQVKSSPEKKFADNWANRLKSKGYEAFVVAGEVNGQTWYRVRVGRFAARQEAEALRDKLETKDGLKGSFVTKTKAAEIESSGGTAEAR